MRKNFRSGRFLPATLLSLTLIGCAHQPAAVVDRELPSAPSFMAPTERPTYRLNADPRLELKKTVDKLDEANDRLSQSRGWYDEVRDDFRKGAP